MAKNQFSYDMNPTNQGDSTAEDLRLARAAFENEGWGEASGMSAHRMVRSMAETNTILRAEFLAVIEDLIAVADIRAREQEGMDGQDLEDARALVAKYKGGAKP